MPPQQQRGYNHAARKRTATLPKAIRQELEQLGHIDPQNTGKGRLGRKDRRKQERRQPKQNRALHQNAAAAPAATTKKRPAAEDSGPATKAPVASTSQPSRAEVERPAKKRARFSEQDAAAAEEPSPDAAAAPARPQTALEKRVAKQERGHGSDPERRRTKNDTDEDKEIAWLEAKLGLPRGLSRTEKGKMKAEYDEDGLGGESLACYDHGAPARRLTRRPPVTQISSRVWMTWRALHSARPRRCVDSSSLN